MHTNSSSDSSDPGSEGSLPTPTRGFFARRLPQGRVDGFAVDFTVSCASSTVAANEARALESLFLKDFRRLQTMHSWYKRIAPVEGVRFVIYLAVGQQVPNSICMDDVDAQGLHWHFVPMRSAKEIPTHIRSYTITLGPFLRGVEADGHFMGIDTIRANNPDLEEWLASNYPNISIDALIHENEEVCATLARSECTRYLTSALPVVTRYIHEQGTRPYGQFASRQRFDVLV
jgi:hypothetical protein